MSKISIFAAALLLISVGAWTMMAAPRVDASTAGRSLSIPVDDQRKELAER